MTRPPQAASKYVRIRRLGTDGPFEVEVGSPCGRPGAQQAVLLKRLRPGWPVSSQALSRFLEDSRSACGFDHPNIVRVLDIARDENGPFLVTEYSRGVSLAAALRRIRSSGQSLPLTHTLTVVRQACEGLKAAQAAGRGGRSLVHGAISPEHLVITFEGLVKCKDFGIFRLYPLDQRDSLGGPDPAYLSPEQAQGLQPNIRSDVFALGRVFQKLLSLTAEGSTDRLPPGLIQVLSELLTEDPAGRIQSAAILGKRLEEPVPNHGSGDVKTDRVQLGAFVRGLFKTRAAPREDSKVRPGKPIRKPARSKDAVGLLDPAAFWEEGEPGPPPVEEQDIAGEEVTGEALVVSEPPGRPDDLSLPESIPVPVAPRPPTGAAPRIPQEDFLKVGKTSSIRVPSAAIVAVACLLLVLVGWLLFSGGDKEDEITEAASTQPVAPQGPQAVSPGSPETVSEPTRSPPPASAKTGILKLDSNPPGALVYVDDEKKGVTPLTVKDACLGTEVSIRIELEGHRPWTQTVQLDEDNPVREFTAGLLKEEVCELGSGWIYVTTEPEGGTVEIDGKRLPGKTPKIIDKVCAGVEHEIRVQATGFRAWSTVVRVEPQKVVNLNIELER
jgi:hypothetical protein